jgi:hypothetical protein
VWRCELDGVAPLRPVAHLSELESER